MVSQIILILYNGSDFDVDYIFNTIILMLLIHPSTPKVLQRIPRFWSPLYWPQEETLA